MNSDIQQFLNVKGQDKNGNGGKIAPQKVSEKKKITIQNIIKRQKEDQGLNLERPISILKKPEVVNNTKET